MKEFADGSTLTDKEYQFLMDHLDRQIAGGCVRNEFHLEAFKAIRASLLDGSGFLGADVLQRVCLMGDLLAFFEYCDALVVYLKNPESEKSVRRLSGLGVDIESVSGIVETVERKKRGKRRFISLAWHRSRLSLSVLLKLVEQSAGRRVKKTDAMCFIDRAYDQHLI